MNRLSLLGHFYSDGQGKKDFKKSNQTIGMTKI